MTDTPILVPVDTSPLAEAAVAVTADLAQALSRPVCLLTVVDSTVCEEVTDFAEVEHIAISEAVTAYLERLAAPLRRRGIDVGYARMDGGWRAADGIIAFAEDHKVSMIVMSSHGRSGFRRMVLGSVAEKVVRSSMCPVVIVPVRGDAAQDIV